MKQKKTNSKTSAAKTTATKKRTPKKTGVSKAASKKASAKKPPVKKVSSKKAAPKRFSAAATSLKFRAVCLTHKKTLGIWTTNEQAARDAATQHEIDFPSHVTDVEEKG